MFSLLMFVFACQSGPTESQATQNKQEVNSPSTATAKNNQKPVESEPAKFTEYGKSLSLTEIVSAKTFLADPSKYTDKEIRVSGKVTQICQKAGCWLVIAEGEKSMRITTKDHAFLVKKDASGVDCEVEGVVRQEKKQPEKIAHYAGETEKGKVIPENQVEGDSIFTMVASGVRFYEK